MQATHAERISFWNDNKDILEINVVVIIGNVCSRAIQRKVPGFFYPVRGFYLSKYHNI
jgi:hypothetical protein